MGYLLDEYNRKIAEAAVEMTAACHKSMFNTNNKKESTMTSTQLPRRYAYDITVEIDAIPGTDATSAAVTLARFMESSIVWRHASERNVKAVVVRRVVPSLPHYNESNLPQEFSVFKKGGALIEVSVFGDMCAVAGENGLHRIPTESVLRYLNATTWTMA